MDGAGLRHLLLLALVTLLLAQQAGVAAAAAPEPDDRLTGKTLYQQSLLAVLSSL
jgi:hypothetical protein